MTERLPFNFSAYFRSLSITYSFGADLWPSSNLRPKQTSKSLEKGEVEALELRLGHWYSTIYQKTLQDC